LEEELKTNEGNQDIIFRYLTSMKQTYDKAKQGAEDQEHIRLQVQQLNTTIKETEKKAADYVEQMKDFIDTIEMNVFLPRLSASLSPEIDAIRKKKDELRKTLEQRYTPEEVEDITNKVIDYLKEFALIANDVDPKNVTNHILATQKDFVAHDDYAFLDDIDLEALNGLKKLNAVNNFVQLDNQRKSLDEQIKELTNLRIQRDTLQSTLTQGSTNIIKEYEEKKRELLSVLLDMNCFYSGVGDGVLGKPKDSDDIIYTQTLPVDEELSGRKLHETFVRFADSAKSLKGYLEKTLAEVQNRQGGSSGDPFAMFV
jgi:DNA sulfur modification protein DndD